MKDVQPIQDMGPAHMLSNPEHFTGIAQMVQEHVKKNKLFANIHGKEYPMVEAWQFFGALVGIFAIVTDSKNISSGNETKYSATVELRDSKGNLRGRATASCSNKESKKRNFDEYAIESMAQTRATGKAFRISYGWIMKAAGFQSTPSEEMDFELDETEKKYEAQINALKSEKEALTIRIKKAEKAYKSLRAEYRQVAMYAIESAAQHTIAANLAHLVTSINDEGWNKMIDMSLRELEGDNLDKDLDEKALDHGTNFNNLEKEDYNG